MRTISRRDAIKKMAITLGGTLAIPDILKAWDNLTILNPNFSFTASETELIAEIAEMIVPATDTPGAKEAGVPDFIMKVVADCFNEEEQEMFKRGLQSIDLHVKKNFNTDGFVNANFDVRYATLETFEKWHKEAPSEKKFWRTIKELSVTGYFTSEIGCTQALRYEPVPGSYNGALPYKKGDKAWAT